MEAMALGLASAGASVHWLALNPIKHRVDRKAAIEALDRARLKQDLSLKLELIEADGRPTRIGAALQFFRGESYFTSRFRPAQFVRKLLDSLEGESYDGVQLEGASMLGLIREIRRRHHGWLVFRAHNLECRIWERMALNARTIRKFYLLREAKKLENWEVKGARSCDALVAIGAPDLEGFRQLGYSGKATVARFGLELVRDVKSEARSGDVFFVGSFDWLPNREAIEWFLESVWPEVHRRFPEKRMRILGRHAPADFSRIEGVELLPESFCADRGFQTASLLIAPYSSGSGIRIKIVEALSHGCPVVSTRVGAEGISEQNLLFLRLAETPEDWIRTLSDFFEEPQSNMERMGEAAKEFVREHFDRDLIGRNLFDFYDELSAGRSTSLNSRW